MGGKAQEPSLYLLERIKSIIVTLFSKVEAKEKKRREAALGLVAYKIRATTVSNIVISCEFWEMVSVGHQTRRCELRYTVLGTEIGNERNMGLVKADQPSFL